MPTHAPYLRSLVRFSLVSLLVSSLALLAGPSPNAWAAATPTDTGHVYVLNNDLSGSNSITVFKRAPDGTLSQVATTPIGGLGSLTAFADGTQGSMILANGRSRLFAVDAGSDEISVINNNKGALSLAGVFPSGGSGPVSLTYRQGLLYVLNAANASPAPANVAGFQVDAAGTLHPITGATRALSNDHPNPAQVQIDPAGRFLLVTEKGTSLIDLYPINPDGSLGNPTFVPSVGAVPFGMAFNPASQHLQLVVADAAGGANGATGAATAYRLVDGTLQLINGPVDDFQVAPCWMVMTSNGHFAYTSDADSFTISGYLVHDNGAISLLNADGVTAHTPSDTFPLEEGLSRNSRYLYVLDSRLLLPVPGPATLSGFLIQPDGSLTSVVDESRIVLPFSAIGMAAE